MSQFSVGGPLSESHLSHELGSYPVRTFVRLRSNAERTVGSLEPLQQRHHSGELALVEPCADVADVDEGVAFAPRLTFRVARARSRRVDAQQQRAEVRAAMARLRPAADHEALAADDLHPAPVRR